MKGSGINILSSLSGLSRKDIKEIAIKVIENNKILNACSTHNFTLIEKRKWKCSNCGGVVDTTKKIWYEKGLKHAEGKK